MHQRAFISARLAFQVLHGVWFNTRVGGASSIARFENVGLFEILFENIGLFENLFENQATGKEWQVSIPTIDFPRCWCWSADKWPSQGMHRMKSRSADE